MSSLDDLDVDCWEFNESEEADGDTRSGNRKWSGFVAAGAGESGVGGGFGIPRTRPLPRTLGCEAIRVWGGGLHASRGCALGTLVMPDADQEVGLWLAVLYRSWRPCSYYLPTYREVVPGPTLRPQPRGP